MRKPKKLNPRHLTVLALLGALGGLMLAGCEIVEPRMPSYTTHLAVPLGQERLDIADVIEDEDYLIAMPDSTLGFRVDGDPDTVSLDFELAADIEPQSVTGELGNVSLDVADPPSFDFALVDLYPAAAALDGMTMPVPGFDFTTESGPEDLADVESATIASGTLTVTVSNGLPVPVSAPSGPDRLVLELFDPATGDAVVSLDFDPIAAGEQTSRVHDLAGTILPGALAVRLAGGSPGSDGTPVLVDAGVSIGVEAAFADVLVSAAEAVIEAQEFTTSFSTELPEDYEVVQAVIAAGDVTLSVVNEMAIRCQATVTWPEVVDLDDQPLQLILDLEPFTSADRTVSFAGHIVRAPEGSQLTELGANVRVTSPGSDGVPVLVAADQGIRADLDGGRIEFGSVTGVVPELSYDFDPIDEEIDLPDEIDGLNLTRATMVLSLTNTAGLGAETDLTLVGINESGHERSLTVQEPIAPADGGRATVTEIVLDENNSTLIEFLNNMPTSIQLAGGVNVGGDGEVGTVRAGDYAVIAWEIIAPVEVVIESSHLYGDPDALDFDEDLRENIADYAGAAALQLEVLNHLPVGIEASVLFGPDTLTIKTDPLLAIGPVAIEAASVDPITHAVSEPRVCYPTISLSAGEVQLLATEGLYQIFSVTLPSTDGEPVRVLTTDYVELNGLIELDVHVHDDDE